jgi:pyruvate formate lyase activating enzyme
MSEAGLKEREVRGLGGGLAERLRELTRGGGLMVEEGGGKVRCVACGHRCLLREGRRGICKVRYVEGGELRVPRGYVAALQCDPVEKKPFFHVLPGSLALTFGMLGCDFHCGYCQNWVTSQALRDPLAVGPFREVSAEELVGKAGAMGARLVVSSYNEPLITLEWAEEVFAAARGAGLACAFVSNGNATPEALDRIGPYLTAYKVDLKSFRQERYRELGGVLEHVKWTIGELVRRGIWCEVVTLVVPGFNDDLGELGEMAAFLAGVSVDLPWHLTGFQPQYRMSEREATEPDLLEQAAELGRAAGLRHVYVGNRPGQVGGWEDSHCGGCGEVVVRRRGFEVLEMRLGAGGVCGSCGAKMPGVWELLG